MRSNMWLRSYAAFSCYCRADVDAPGLNRPLRNKTRLNEGNRIYIIFMATPDLSKYLHAHNSMYLVYNYQLYHGFLWNTGGYSSNFLVFFSVFHEPLGEWNTEKNTKKLREYHRYFLKTHGITVLSYNYLIFSHHNAFYRQLTGVKRDFFHMYVCSSSMMNAKVNNS